MLIRIVDIKSKIVYVNLSHIICITESMEGHLNIKLSDKKIITVKNDYFKRVLKQNISKDFD